MSFSLSLHLVLQKEISSFSQLNASRLTLCILMTTSFKSWYKVCQIWKFFQLFLNGKLIVKKRNQDILYLSWSVRYSNSIHHYTTWFFQIQDFRSRMISWCLKPFVTQLSLPWNFSLLQETTGTSGLFPVFLILS